MFGLLSQLYVQVRHCFLLSLHLAQRFHALEGSFSQALVLLRNVVVLLFQCFDSVLVLADLCERFGKGIVEGCQRVCVEICDIASPCFPLGELEAEPAAGEGKPLTNDDLVDQVFSLVPEVCGSLLLLLQPVCEVLQLFRALEAPILEVLMRLPIQEVLHAGGAPLPPLERVRLIGDLPRCYHMVEVVDPVTVDLPLLHILLPFVEAPWLDPLIVQSILPITVE